MEYIIGFGLLIWAIIAFRRSQDRAFTTQLEQQRAAERKAAIAEERAARVARAAKFPEPRYALGDDPALAEIERVLIEREVGSWFDFEIDEKDALQPFIAAGEDLTRDLQEAIIAEERETLFLRVIADAKLLAREEYDANRNAKEADQREIAEAKRRLGEFVARQRTKTDEG